MRLFHLFEDDDAPTLPPEHVEVVHAFPDVATIDASLLPELELRIEKLNKQATKVGAPPITIDVLGSEYKDVTQGTMVLRKKMIRVRVNGNPPKMAGWSLVARVEHMENNAILHVVPGEDNPELRRFYKAEPDRCDHCHKVRRRIDTFIVRNNLGEYKQVGRNCLRDFLGGKDPKGILWYVSAFQDLSEMLNIMRTGGGGSSARSEYYQPFEVILAAAVALSNKYGYVSSKSETKTPTSAEVRFAYFTMPTAHETHNEQEIRHVATIDAQSPNVKKEVEDIVKWFDALPKEKLDEPFFHNVHAIREEGHVSSRSVGYVVGLIPTYRREMGLIKQRQQFAASQHVGQVGQKIPPTQVEVIGVRDYHSGFGPTQIVRFRDTNGNTLSWFNNSSDRDFQRGDHMTIIGTVKKHDEYQGHLQTLLTRVKVLNRQ